MVCGTERVISPAPLLGALRGVPAEGVAGDSIAAPAQGNAFPNFGLVVDRGAAGEFSFNWSFGIMGWH